MKINIYGPVNDLGYGVHTKGLALGLEEVVTEEGAVDVSLIPLGKPEVTETDERRLHLLLGKGAFSHHMEVSIGIQHEWMLNQFPGSVRIGFPVFETTKIVKGGIHHMKQMDHIFVPSHWAQGVCEMNGITGVSVIPEGVDGGMFNPTVQAAQAAKDSKFTFVSVGKYEQRKGCDLLLDAMREEFYKHEVRLMAFWHNPFVQNWDQHIHNEMTAKGFSRDTNVANRTIYRMGKCHVELIGRVSNRMNLAQLMKAADCAVFPHRAEGWGLPVIESLAMGIPTIATNYSGPTEYLRDTNALLIQPQGTEVANDGIWFKGDRGDWAKLRLEDVVEPMLKAFNDLDSVPTDPEGIVLDWSWKNAGEKVTEVVKELTNGS